MNTTAKQSPAAHDALSRDELAALAAFRTLIYGFLAAAFNHPADAQFAERLAGADLADILLSIGQAADLPSDVQQGIILIERFIEAVHGRSLVDVQNDVSIERTRLVRGIKPGYGPLPPYESVYKGQERQPDISVLAAVGNAYAHAGVGLPENLGEQPDYIGLELDFMRLLTQQEASAWSADADEARRIVHIEHSFIHDHMAGWVSSYCDAMYADAQLDFYRGLALMTKGFVTDEVSLSDELLAA